MVSILVVVGDSKHTAQRTSLTMYSYHDIGYFIKQRADRQYDPPIEWRLSTARMDGDNDGRSKNNPVLRGPDPVYSPVQLSTGTPS